MGISKIIKKIIFGEKSDSASYVRYMRKKGVKIGEGAYLVSPRNIHFDLTRPFLLEIGDHVKFAHGVTVLTHGFDWSVANCKYGDILGSAGKVKIGNNVFLGVGTIVLPGVTIGNNVIIGAGSVVNHDIPDDSVAVGNPAHVVCDIETYYEKRKNAQIEEAKLVAVEYLKRYGKKPSKEVLQEFFWLFEERGDNGFDTECFEKRMHTNGNYDLAVARHKSYERPFQNYEAFLAYCYKE